MRDIRERKERKARRQAEQRVSLLPRAAFRLRAAPFLRSAAVLRTPATRSSGPQPAVCRTSFFTTNYPKFLFPCNTVVDSIYLKSKCYRPRPFTLILQHRQDVGNVGHSSQRGHETVPGQQANFPGLWLSVVLTSDQALHLAKLDVSRESCSDLVLRRQKEKLG